MFKGEVEVSWSFFVKEGETLIALRVPASGELAHLKQGDRMHATFERLPPAPRPPGVRTRLAALAGRWCNDPEFQQWLGSTFPGELREARRGIPWVGAREKDVDRDVAAAIVRTVCEVKSRSEFDSDCNAAARFDRLIRLAYHMWLNARHPTTHPPPVEAT